MLPLAGVKVNPMDQIYWLERKRAAAKMARRAQSSRARLVHLDLAGRYSIKAAACAATALRRNDPVDARPQLALSPPSCAEQGDAAFGGTIYYERLETGARWLASRAAAPAERDEHLGMATRYARLRLEAAHGRR